MRQTARLIDKRRTGNLHAKPQITGITPSRPESAIRRRLGLTAGLRSATNLDLRAACKIRRWCAVRGWLGVRSRRTERAPRSGALFISARPPPGNLGRARTGSSSSHAAPVAAGDGLEAAGVTVSSWGKSRLGRYKRPRHTICRLA